MSLKVVFLYMGAMVDIHMQTPMWFCILYTISKTAYEVFSIGKSLLYCRPEDFDLIMLRETSFNKRFE